METKPEEVIQTETVTLPVTSDTVRLIQHIAGWHGDGIAKIANLIDNAKAGMTLKLGKLEDATAPEIPLDEIRLAGFKMGLTMALIFLGDFPVKLSQVPEPEVAVEPKDE